MLNGKFAIFQGKEYKANRKKGRITLFSHDDKDKNLGFHLNPTGTALILEVEEGKVTKYYNKMMVCDFCNDTFDIIEETSTDFVLYSPEKKYSLSNIGFSQVSRGEYQIRVPKTDVNNVRYIEELL